jgi:predicted aspartyl protease
LSFPFNTSSGLIIVQAELTGPGGRGTFRLALDTGATTTLMDEGMLRTVGYDVASGSDRVAVTTGSGVESVRQIELQRLTTPGYQRYGMKAPAHTLPQATGVDGVLGPDFFQGLCLTIDFRVGTILLD